MKKILSLLAVAVLMLSLLGVSAFAGVGVIIPEGQPANGITSSNVQTVTGAPAVVYDENGVRISDPAGGAEYYGGKVTVTKSPTSETVKEGGKATFVAHAANATNIVWRLVSADGLETIQVSAIGNYFNGVTTWGLGTDSLTIKNISERMNGWQVEAQFDGEGGPVFSAGARITVVGSTANGTTTDVNPDGRVVVGGANGKTPTITEQPAGALLSSGRSTTLSVTAGVADGSTLHYQWYVTSDKEIAGQAIAGATSASYTPGELPGSRFYYVGVWSEKDGVKSDTIYSEMAEVVYPETAPTPTPTPAPTPAPASTTTTTTSTNGGGTTGNTTPTNTNTNTNTNSGSGLEIVTAPGAEETGTEPSPSPEPSPTPEATRSTENGSSLPVILGAIAAVALASGVGLLVLRRNAGQ